MRSSLWFRCAVLALPGIALAAAPRVPSPTPTGKVTPFQAKTAWGTVLGKALRDGNDCRVEVSSDADMTGWLLRSGTGSETLSKGSLPPCRHFRFQVPGPLPGTLHLTLYLEADHEQVPVSIPIEPAPAASPTAADLEGDDYEEDPDHPYHRMVHTLYDQALASYSQGDLSRAGQLLGKATELDPNQPQVRALWSKVRVRKAGNGFNDAKDPEDGEQEKALDVLGKVMRDDPDSGENHGRVQAVRKTSRAGKPKAPPTPPTQPATDQDRKDAQAKSDEAYNLGLDCYRKDDFATARKFWEQALRARPDNPAARRSLDQLLQDHPELKSGPASGGGPSPRVP